MTMILATWNDEHELRPAKLPTINTHREPTVEEPSMPSAASTIAMSSGEILEGSIEPGQPRLAITINDTNGLGPEALALLILKSGAVGGVRNIF